MPEKNPLTRAIVPSGATHAIRRSSGAPVATAHADSPRFHWVFGVLQSEAKVFTSSENAPTCVPTGKPLFDVLNKLTKNKATITATTAIVGLKRRNIEDEPFDRLLPSIRREARLIALHVSERFVKVLGVLVFICLLSVSAAIA